MTGYVADLSWKSGARAIEKLDRLRSTMAVNVLSDRHAETHSEYQVECLLLLSDFDWNRDALIIFC